MVSKHITQLHTSFPTRSHTHTHIPAQYSRNKRDGQCIEDISDTHKFVQEKKPHRNAHTVKKDLEFKAYLRVIFSSKLLTRCFILENIQKHFQLNKLYSIGNLHQILSLRRQTLKRDMAS